MSKTKIKQQVVINYSRDDECRIAILEDGRLEEFYSERASEDLHVGNIYLGTVMNLEPAIQAAFVDFGIGRNGFLHISDIHPMFFPGSMREETESVGRKTPHRDRPPIQQCLRKGQRIIVQVLKEGIGTKGPTLTTYPSIPGRYVVLLPYMEQHGVSRKIEDFETRRKARDILDSLDLPKEFGFILRTAGLDRNKTELKRDVAYLVRLWKDIEKKRKSTRGPTELYAESDLLLRTIRDVVSPDVNRIWIDDADAMRQAEDYLRIVAPRQRRTKLLLHNRATPIFHDFGIEEQINLMHEREVPLPCGGSLIIDSTEAMVAIDVNSGRARKYKDAETTAHKVNLEAVDEIARQLRLRDLGGLIVMDLIDMRNSRHQRDVENRFRDNLKRDRAKTEFQRISRFGILEMTRQRMRPSLRKSHFIDCPQCEGRGHVKSAESTISDAVRNLAFLLDHPKVHKAELVVSPTIAGVILSQKRGDLVRLEQRIGKTVDIRISRSIAPDRIDFYAYDESSLDLDITQLRSASRSPASAEADPLPIEESTKSEIADEEKSDEPPTQSEDLGAKGEQQDNEKKSRSSRRGRRGRGKKAKDAAAAPAAAQPKADQKPDSSDDGDDEQSRSKQDKPKKKKRRSRKKSSQQTSEKVEPESKDSSTRKRSRRSKRKTKATTAAEPNSNAPKSQEPQATSNDADSKADASKIKRKQRKRRARRSSGESKSESNSTTTPTAEPKPADDVPAPQTRRRRLYKSRRRLSPAELVRVDDSDD